MAIRRSDAAMAAAAAPGSAALVMGLPMTSRSAPARMASSGVATRAWSFASLPAGRTPTPRDWARLSEAWREDLDDRIRQLQNLRDRLTGCIGCGCLSISACQLANPGDVLGHEGPGPRKL